MYTSLQECWLYCYKMGPVGHAPHENRAVSVGTPGSFDGEHKAVGHTPCALRAWPQVITVVNSVLRQLIQRKSAPNGGTPILT